MHNDSRGTEAIAEYGGSLGVYGPDFIKNALTIEIDTYMNSDYSLDAGIDEDITTHVEVTRPAEKEDFIIGVNRWNTQWVKDGSFLSDNWFEMNISWDAADRMLTYKVGHFEQMTFKIDDLNDWFGGTKVYWGFTGGTGSVHCNFQSVAVMSLPQEPTLSLIKTVRNVTAGEAVFAADTEANPGDVVEYQIAVENLSASVVDLKNTVFEDDLGSDLTYLANTFTVNGSVVTPSIAAGQLEASIGDIDVGQSTTIKFQCRLDGSGDGGIVKNRASVNSLYSTAHDTSDAYIYVQPKIDISKTVSTNQTYTGDTLTYTLILRNDANAGYWDGKVIDQLSDDLENITAFVDTGNSVYSGAALSPVVSAAKLLTIDNITLKNGEYLTFIIQADINTDNEQIGSDYKIQNQAQAIGSGRAESGSTPEKTTVSNQVETRLEQDRAAFTIAKELKNGPASELQTFVFRIDYKKDEAAALFTETYYGSIQILPGQSTASIDFGNMRPGYYAVTEVQNSWEYTIDSTTPVIQDQTLNWQKKQSHTFEFLNNHDNIQWQRGHGEIINKMNLLN